MSSMPAHMRTAQRGAQRPSVCWRRSVRNPLRSCCAIATQQELPTYDGLWNAFASKVQGEWEGRTVTFDAQGVAQPLPDRYVPSAYREWGIVLKDWQSQTSALLDPAPGNDRRLRSKFKRLMPTVGCEAEAVAYVEEAADVWQVDGGNATKPVTPCGGYVAAPPELPADGSPARVEACLAAPDGQTRLRVVVTLLPDWQSKEWTVTSANVTREAFDGPYNGGVELCGCSPNKTSAFVDAAPTTLEQLAGDWRVTALLVFERSSEGEGLELQPSAGPPLERASSLAGEGALLLPPGVWVGCKAAGSSVDVEMGALRGDSERDLAVCSFRGGRLQRVLLASEAK